MNTAEEAIADAEAELDTMENLADLEEADLELLATQQEVDRLREEAAA